jgi:hypothetical protein
VSAVPVQLTKLDCSVETINIPRFIPPMRVLIYVGRVYMLVQGTSDLYVEVESWEVRVPFDEQPSVLHYVSDEDLALAGDSCVEAYCGLTIRTWYCCTPKRRFVTCTSCRKKLGLPG